jgi:hypothetical protein
VRPYLKKKKIRAKRAGGVAQVVELLPSKCETLSSNPSIRKEGRREGGEEGTEEEREGRRKGGRKARLP